MSRPSTHPAEWGPLGPDPGQGIRVMIALVLRLGIGLSLLNSGLAAYMNVRAPVGGPMTTIANVSFAGVEPLISALPYLSIGLGLALILGFLTTPSAVAAGFFGLLTPLMTTVAIVSGGLSGGGGGFGPGMGRFGGDPFQALVMTMGMSTYLTGLIPQAALIWLSPLENHPYSVDALIFGRNAVELIPPPDDAPAPAGRPEPSAIPEEPAA